jgi:hypothetical protein
MQKTASNGDYMSDKKYIVPKGMLKAAGEASNGVDPDGYFLYTCLIAALRWQDENLPSVVTSHSDHVRTGYENCLSDIRRMYLAPEPEAPKVDLSDLLYSDCMIAASEHNDEIYEAFRRGQQSKDGV